jgi:hypothetical protein
MITRYFKSFQHFTLHQWVPIKCETKRNKINENETKRNEINEMKTK